MVTWYFEINFTDRLPTEEANMDNNVKVPAPVRRLCNRMLRIFFYSDLHGVRLLLAVSELVWAYSLIRWQGSFARPTYCVMSKVMAEQAWGLVFALSGVTQLLILLDGRYHERFSVIFAGWNSVLWWFAVVSMYLSVYPPAPGISGELGLAIGATWVFARSGVGPTGRRSSDNG